MKITSGKIPSAQKVLIYGPEGIGKSTLAAQFPDPLFIDVEGSTKHMDVKRLPTPTSWTMLKEAVAYVRLNPGVCKTLIIDTADWAEILCTAQVTAKAQVNGIEDFGYGKGYTYLAEEFGNLLNLLTEVIEAGIHVVLTAHAMIKKFEQPDEASAYDRWELKLQKKTAPLVKEWADMVLFANYKTFAVTDAKTKKTTAQGGKRVIYTSHRPAWDAKNRHGLPDEIPLADGVMPEEIAEAIAFEPLKDQGGTVASAATPTVESVAEELGAKHVPPHLARLHDLVTEAGITIADVQAAVAHKGYYPAGTPVENYDPGFVDGVLVGAWQQVLGIIAELKQIPFK